MCLTPLMNFWPLHYLSQRRMSLTPKSCQNRLCIQYPSEKPSAGLTREVTSQPQCANPRDRPSCTWDIHAWKKYMRDKYINTHPSGKRKSECKLHVSDEGLRSHLRVDTLAHTLTYSNWPSSELNKIWCYV